MTKTITLEEAPARFADVLRAGDGFSRAARIPARQQLQNLKGAREPAYSSETPSIRLRARAGKVASCWRHPPPSVRFQSRSALMS